MQENHFNVYISMLGHWTPFIIFQNLSQIQSPTKSTSYASRSTEHFMIKQSWTIKISVRAGL